MSSPPLRIELRTSGLLRAALVALAALASIALWRSAAPPWMPALPWMMLPFAWPRVRGERWSALALRGDGTASLLDDASGETPVEPRVLQRRGPLTALTVQLGQRRLAFVFLPDTLDRRLRRELVLWFARNLPVDGRVRAGAHV
jgi:hypothetical protein